MQFGDIRQKVVLPLSGIMPCASPLLLLPTSYTASYRVFAALVYTPLVAVLLIIERCLQYPDHHRNRAGLVSAFVIFD